jgi:hypothetical protein
MRAYLIDPWLQRVSVVDLLGKNDSERADHMRKLIGCDGLDHMTISDEHDTIWLDDRGLTRGQPVYAFRFRIIKDPCAGKGIIVGADDEGRTRAPYFPLDLLTREIIWLGLIVPQVDWIEDGNTLRAVITFSRPKQ